MTKYRSNEKGSMRKIIFIILICLVIVGAATAGGGALFYQSNLKPVSSSTESKQFTVESGATAKQIGSDLEAAGLIRNKTVFDYYLWFHGVRDTLQAGSYYLKPSMSVQDIVGVLSHGKVATHLLTVLPGKRIDQIQESFVKSGYTQAEVDAAFSADNYKQHPALADKPAGADLEGYLYPDSFQKTSNTKAEVIVKLSLDEMDRNLTPDIKAGFAKQGLTVYQGITLASIVEQEVSHAPDRPTVAQVFLTRMKQNISLGSDVTALYGAIHDGLKLPSDKAQATAIGIAHDSPYNTRMHTGLPPGPISNVSASSLHAVAFPSNTDYLFFVAGDDGTTYFAHTLQEHEANAQKYCHKLCGR